MKYRQIAKKLTKLGCEEIESRRSGSHRIWFNPDTGAETCIPDWRGKDLKQPTLRSALKKLGIDYQTFLKT